MTASFHFSEVLVLCHSIPTLCSHSLAFRSVVTPIQLFGYGIAFAGVMYYNYQKIQVGHSFFNERHFLLGMAPSLPLSLFLALTSFNSPCNSPCPQGMKQQTAAAEKAPEKMVERGSSGSSETTPLLPTSPTGGRNQQ